VWLSKDDHSTHAYCHSTQTDTQNKYESNSDTIKCIIQIYIYTSQLNHEFGTWNQWI
jgi:hypothetical protein